MERTDHQAASGPLGLGHAADVSPHLGGSLGEGAVECGEHSPCGVVLCVEIHEMGLDLEGAWEQVSRTSRICGLLREFHL